MSTNAAARRKAKAAKIVYLSTKTGRVVSPATAARYPSKTVAELVRTGKPKVAVSGAQRQDMLVAVVTDRLPQTAVRTGFLIDTLGSAAEVARLLGVNRSQPAQWRSGKESPAPRTAQQLLDLDYVMARALQIWPAATAMEWFHGSNDYLDGARPIDVLKRRGASEVVKALEIELA